MFHLAHKVYLCHDSMIDTNKDRVVVSRKNGYYMHEVIEQLASGKLLKASTKLDGLLSGKDIADFFSELIEYSITTDNPLYIYADKTSLAMLQMAWFNLIFKEPTFEACVTLFKSNTFKFNMFYKGRFSSNNGSEKRISFSYSDTVLKTLYEKLPTISSSKKRAFMARYVKYMSIEYLLASYVYNGSMKTQLKQNIIRLLRKDIEKYIYELKEIFIVHFTTRTFKDRLKLEKDYNIFNINDILSDRSKFAELFMSNRVFSVSGMDVPSSKNGKNIKLENLTEDDIVSLKEFTVLSGTTWGEEAVYQFIKSDINKLDFIDVLTLENFTDERLEDLLNAEATYEHAAGSFFSIDLETVNNYTIEYILDTRFKNDKENLRSMTLC
jgi:hypothetical protein